MVKTVYADVLFAINFIINYLLLFITARIATLRISRARLAFSSTLGALYAALALLPELYPFLFFPSKLLFALLMTVLAFGRVSLLRTYLTFLASAAFFAGISLLLSSLAPQLFSTRGGFIYINISLPVLLVSSALSYLILRIIFSRRAAGEKKTSRVTITSEEKKLELTALLDTGNALRTPHDNARVVISDYTSLRPVLPDFATEILDDMVGKSFSLSLDKIPDTSRFSLIPYKTVGVSFSLLLTFSPDKICIDGKEEKGAVCAISEAPVSDGSGYNALI